MLTAILTEPDWITVPCGEKLSNIIVCQSYTVKRSDIIANSYLKNIWCEEGHLFIQNRCILFKQLKKLTNFDKWIVNLCRKEKLSILHQNMNSSLTGYFSLMQHYFMQPLEFIIPLPETFVIFSSVQSSSYKMLHWMETITNETISQADGYLLFPTYSSQIAVPIHLFHCSDGSYIHESLICNGIMDCTEGTDEKSCTCSNSSQSLLLCKHSCDSNTEICTCSDFFYQCSLNKCIPYLFVCDGYKDCQEGKDEICSSDMDISRNKSQPLSNNETFKCMTSGLFIPASFVDDLIPNCPGSFEDEVQYYNLLTVPHYPMTTCNTSNELPCIPGHSLCFPLSKLCIYDLQHNSSQLKYCKNGAHLYNCSFFECHGHFKCPFSYCIPFDLVCNRNWDCPGGHDEYNCVLHSCSHLFKCKNHTKCLHFSKVCDQNKDCVFGDDELSCTTGYTFSCPLQCFCFAQTIICNQLSQVKYPNIWNFIKYFKCYNCTLFSSNFHFSTPLSLHVMDLKDHLSTYICISKNQNSSMFSTLRKLDMSFNNIIIVKSLCFISLQSLKILHLQNNQISCVQNKAFYSLKKLKTLDLSHNRITKVSKMIFIGLHNTKIINLTANLIVSIYPYTFILISHRTIHSSNRKVCCMSGSWLKCKVKTNAFLNCKDLLPRNSISEMFFFIGILTVMLNLIAEVIHIKLFSLLQTNKFFTLGLSLIDCLFGIYLLTISFADLYYRGYFAGVEFQWKQSFVCHVSSFTALVSLITSPIIVFVMMLARFCVIQWPMTSKFKSEKFSKKVMFTIIVILVGCCFIIEFTFMIVHGSHLPNRMCLLLYTNGYLSKFILFTSMVVICIQTICLILIMTLNILTISVLNRMDESYASVSSKKAQYTQIKTHLLIVILTNVCCWIPSSISFILPLVGYKVPSTLLVWVIITVFPINFVVNPILFSIVTPAMKRWVSSACSSRCCSIIQ